MKLSQGGHTNISGNSQEALAVRRFPSYEDFHREPYLPTVARFSTCYTGRVPIVRYDKMGTWISHEAVLVLSEWGLMPSDMLSIYWRLGKRSVFAHEVSIT
jgi:hypothetical protein